MEPNPSKSIFGWRKLIFGMTSLLCVTATEWYVPAGWSTAGVVGIVLITALYYGPPVLKELTKLVDAWKGNSRA